MNKYLKVFGVAAAVAALGVVLAGTVAFAQGPTEGALFGGLRGGHFGPPAESREQMQSTLAEALGMSVDELEAAQAEGKRLDDIAAEQGVELADLQAAMQSARDAHLGQAVEDGLLTQEQVDRIQEHKRDGSLPLGPEGGKGAHPFMDNEQGQIQYEQMQSTLAEALGMSVDELEAAQAEGKRLDDIAAEQGVELADLQAAMQSTRDAQLAQAVEDGLLTQEQVDRIQEHKRDGSFPLGPEGRRVAHPFMDNEQGQVQHEQMQSTLAAALGMSVDELEAAQAEGKRLDEIAEEQGVELADLQAAMQSAREAQLAQAVEDGLLTQERVDRIQEFMSDGDFPFGPGMKGGPRGFPGGLPDND